MPYSAIHPALSAAPSDLTLPDPHQTALFLDFDGTLVDLAAAPGAIEVPKDLVGLLARLDRATAGGLVLISGRSVADIAGWLPGYTGPIVGGHGAEERVAGVIAETVAVDPLTVEELVRAATGFASGRAGILVEPKPTGVVLHYRAVPECAAEVGAMIDGLADRFTRMTRHDAKMAVELRPDGVAKDVSLARWMCDQFAGRVPVMFGDDATDEPALAWVAGAGGVAVKVGEGPTVAPCRLPDPAAVRAALSNWLERN